MEGGYAWWVRDAHPLTFNQRQRDCNARPCLHCNLLAAMVTLLATVAVITVTTTTTVITSVIQMMDCNLDLK